MLPSLTWHRPPCPPRSPGVLWQSCLGKFRPASTIAVGGSPKSGGPGGSSSSRGKQPAPIMRLDDEEVQVSSRSCCTYYELHGRVVGVKGFVILPKSKFGNGLNVGSGSLT